MTPEYVHLPHLADQVPDIPSDTIVSRTLFNDETVKAVLFRFAPGQELSEHTASMPAILQILEGEADLTLGGDAKKAGPGACTYMEPHLPHSIVAKTPLTLLLLLLKAGKKD